MNKQENLDGWAYMVELEDGLSVEQTSRLLNLIPNDIEIIPFTNSDSTYLEANSVAHGFLNNEHFEYLEEIKKTLAEICNDWDNEREDFIYITPSGLRIKMICDFITFK